MAGKERTAVLMQIVLSAHEVKMDTNYQLPQEELEKANQAIKELLQEIDSLSDELLSKDTQIAKCKDAKDVLKILLEAERKAEELKRITKSDLAYNLWHYLRAATTKIRNF